MDEKLNEKKLKLNIEAQKEGGTYSNFATVIHSETEFLLDFGMFLPGRDAIRIGSRVVLAPKTAKQLLRVLQQNIQNYESKFGEISLPKMGPNLPPSSYPNLAQ